MRQPPFHPFPLPIVLVACALLTLGGTARAQDTARATAGTITAGLELFPSNGGGGFMRSYAALGTRRQSLPLIVAPSATVHVPLSGSMRLALYSSYLGSSVSDNYVIFDSVGGTLRMSPGITDNMSTSAVPVVVGIDMVSAPAQFGSHIGVGVGVAVANIEWTTVMQGTSGFEFFRPAINTSGASIAPAFRAVAGVTYDFDDSRSSRTVVRGIYLEGSYLSIPVHRDFFATLRGQGRGGELPEENSATFDLGGASLTFGLIINLTGR